MYQIKNEPNTAYQKRRTTDPITENPNENTTIGVFEEDQKNKNPIEDPITENLKGYPITEYPQKDLII